MRTGRSWIHPGYAWDARALLAFRVLLGLMIAREVYIIAMDEPFMLLDSGTCPRSFVIGMQARALNVYLMAGDQCVYLLLAIHFTLACFVAAGLRLQWTLPCLTLFHVTSS